MKFSVANVQGSFTLRDGNLHVRIEPSGVIQEVPLTMNDWLMTDFRARPKKFRGYWFHKGFLDAWLLTEGLVRYLIATEKPTTVYLDGLSLGAAVSGVGAALLALDGVNVVHNSYGGPRFLWGRKSAERFDAMVDSVRHVYGEDVVTKVPPRIWGYRHGGVLMYEPRVEKWKPFAAFRDHLPHHYDINGWREP